MTNLLLQKDPVWLESLLVSATSGVIGLLSGDGYHVDVPAVLLLAASPLIRTVLSTDHCPPAYVCPVISLPSVAGDVLQLVGTMLATGMANVGVEKMMEVQEAFKMLRIEAELILRFQNSSGSSLEHDLTIRTMEVKGSQHIKSIDTVGNLVTVKSETLNLNQVITEISQSEEQENLLTVKVEPDNEEIKENSDYLQFITEETSNVREVEYTFKEDIPELKLVQNLNVKPVNILHCDQCDKIFFERYNLLKHIRHKHSNTATEFNCAQCPKKFKWKKHLLVHVKGVHELKLFKCHL